MLKKGTLGPGILGQELYEKEIEETTKGRQVFGHGITGAEPDPKLFPQDHAHWLKQQAEKPETKPEPDPAPVDDLPDEDDGEEVPIPTPRPTKNVPFPDMSLEKLKDLVVANPALLDDAIETEFKRQPEPRRGALRFFIETENAEGQREDVLTRLEEALG